MQNEKTDRMMKRREAVNRGPASAAELVPGFVRTPGEFHQYPATEKQKAESRNQDSSGARAEAQKAESKNEETKTHETHDA